MKHTEKEQQKFIDDMIVFMKEINDEHRVMFAVDLAFNAALWLGYNQVESVGILECAKQDLQDSFKECICEECEAKEKESKLRIIDKSKN